MKKFVLIVAAFALLAVSGKAFAGRPPETPPTYKLRVVGTPRSASGTIATGGRDVAMVVVACGSSACTATLADPTSDPGVDGDYGGDGVVVLEVGAAAGGATVLDLTEYPVSFNNQIEFHDDGNVAGIVVYEFR